MSRLEPKIGISYGYGNITTRQEYKNVFHIQGTLYTMVKGVQKYGRGKKRRRN